MNIQALKSSSQGLRNIHVKIKKKLIRDEKRKFEIV